MTELKELPFIEYVESDKSMYPFANTILDKRYDRNFIDDDNDFRIGNSGGFLMNIDFKFINTDVFSEAARTYEYNKQSPDIINWINTIPELLTENKGKYLYCPHLPGTVQYNEYWSRETKRRKVGMTAKCKLLSDGRIVDLHITGDHYNYLNYSRIKRTPTLKEKEELIEKGELKDEHFEGFPRFWDGDYWNFKIDLFIARNKYHLVKGKARGKGYSYKRGSQASNTLNLIPDSVVVLAAYLKDYLIDNRQTADMVKTNLDWLESNTYWKRGYISEGLEEIQLGYRTTKGGNKKKGWGSTLFSVGLKMNSSEAAGKRAIEIDFEESGINPVLEEAVDITLSSTEVGANKIGTIRIYGTAGTKGANWEQFAKMFFTPRKRNMMPFENIWDYNARNKVCGFFHPQVLNLEPFIDKDGNSLLRKAYIWDSEDKALKEAEMTISEYSVYVGQRANTPEEAFKRGGNNIFTSPGLITHANRVINTLESRYYRDGIYVEDSEEGLVFRTNEYLRSNSKLKQFAHDYIEDFPFDPKKDFYGCIREYYPPYKVDGKVPEDLYYVVMDTIAKDKKSNLVVAANSLISIQVYMFPNNYTNTSGDILVACYAGRPEMSEDGDKIFLNLCEAYNAKGLPEVDRGDTVPNFRKWKKLYRLYKDPTIILSNKQMESSNVPYGLNIGSGTNLVDGLTYLRDWLYAKRAVDENGNDIYNYHYIYDIPFLKELLSYNIDGNFDRVSSAVVGRFVLKAQQVKRKDDLLRNNNLSNKSIYEDIGLFNYKR